MEISSIVYFGTFLLAIAGSASLGNGRSFWRNLLLIPIALAMYTAGAAAAGVVVLAPLVALGDYNPGAPLVLALLGPYWWALVRGYRAVAPFLVKVVAPWWQRWEDFAG